MSRSDDIQAELRASAPAAPDHLRARVQTIVTGEPAKRRRPAWGVRRTSLVLVGALVFAAVGAAVVQSMGSSGGHENATGGPAFAGLERAQGAQTTASAGEDAHGPPTHALKAPTATGSDPNAADLKPFRQSGGDAYAAGSVDKAVTGTLGKAKAVQALPVPSHLPPSSLRLQNYDVRLGVRVQNSAALSSATVQAMRWTRAHGGFVASVSYDTPGGRKGDSEFVLRVPVGQVQAALQRFSSLGVLTSQHVSIQDLQGTVNTQTKRIITLNRRIGAILTELEGTLTVDKTAQLQAELAARRQELAALTVAKAATVRQGRLAHIYLELATQAKKKQVVVPTVKPGTIERRLHSAGHVLAQELAVLLAALVILGPFILLGAVGYAAARAQRRRTDRRLLARS